MRSGEDAELGIQAAGNAGIEVVDINILRFES